MNKKEELSKAILLIREYNQMPFYEFVSLFDTEKISLKDIRYFRFTGLNNIDFFKFYIMNKS